MASGSHPHGLSGMTPVEPAADLSGHAGYTSEDEFKNRHPLVPMSARDEYDMRGTSEEDEDDEYVSEESEGDEDVPEEPDEEEEEEPYEEEIVPQVVQDIWVQCDECSKWRKMPPGTDESALPDQWYCHMNPDPAMAAQGHAAPQEPDPAELAPAVQAPPPGTAPPLGADPAGAPPPASAPTAPGPAPGQPPAFPPA